ncbi:NAD(P)H-dependent flavin oxidoreductase [Clostridium sp. 'White wine YQ']|uniref:NAD(P)H-dependent flavin oxidoreductase n=1 Tax=Clostridium sp. 'White wine YQ' TaxID=3027474 RepID=UPI0023671CCC|nr:nitronate monooxygenase family protein [Clostridium sp. 'White wine YQ']MDD7792736.1 nitronate monooxygenase family protein [Clostridium sp. 'White wine YQ']
MDIKPLKIGNLIAKLPIIQGGMGVGVSSSKLAGAVASCGGIGVISGAQIGYTEDDFEIDSLKANLRALKNHIKVAKETAKGGIIGVNLMVAMKNYEEHVKAAIEAGVDIIISGAGLPTNLPKIAKGFNVKLAPIVSSLKGANVILKLWDKHHGVSPDMVVVEGPKAGGHLGFSKDDLESGDIDFDKSVVDIIELVKTYEEKYNKSIPVIAAGGVFDGHDIAKYLKLGASGVQIASRFVATEECDAHINFKNAYINSKKEDIVIVKSPVGMPGRAIKNAFVERVNLEGEKVTKCYNCLVPCDPKTTPYCITKALINAVKGDLDNALIFCGENAYRINKMYTVSELMNELISEAKLS